MPVSWENVYIFISSTFNDMHSERDYLVKQVFPELREWCEKRKLNLIDIDLRWGVTEQDATQNKRVVPVCLERIDACRPFFLCFLGQRRGWVPGPEDISSQAYKDFPALKEIFDRADPAEADGILDNPSITEMEIIHALINPFHGEPSAAREQVERVRYAYFYLREDAYLKDMPVDPPQLRRTYTNEGIANPGQRATADERLRLWREKVLPETQRPIYSYQASWNAQAVTPELAYPLTCPSTNEENIRSWRARWAEVGVTVREGEYAVHSSQRENAEAFNQRLTAGRITGFAAAGRPMAEVILQDLQQGIAERHPAHRVPAVEDLLQREIDQQEQFIQTAAEGFISRSGDMEDLNAYLRGQSGQTFVLTAAAGLGKSSLLARWIQTLRQAEAGPKPVLLFRFVGASDTSTNVNSLLRSLLHESSLASPQAVTEIPANSQVLYQTWLKTIAKNCENQMAIIVLDGINQLESGLSELSWLPWQLPANLKLVVSFKRGEVDAEGLYQSLCENSQVILSEVQPFSSLAERQKLVQGYLSKRFKDLDNAAMQELIELPGAGNPLFLKVLLSELRVFGVFGELKEKISSFGDNPVSAFEATLKRLETDAAYSKISPALAVPLLFGLLAHARHGLSTAELTALLLQTLHIQEDAKDDALQTVNLYLRQVRPFLSHRDGCVDFFYESFKLAALRRYTRPAGEQSTLTRRSAREWHHELAAYFQALPLWQDPAASRPDKRKTAECPYHLAMSAQGEAFTQCLTNFDFLYAKVLAQSASVLLEDYALETVDGLALAAQASADLKCIQKAISLSLQNIETDPVLFAGQLIARLGDFNNPIIQSLVQQAQHWTKEPWIRPLSTHFKQPDSELGFSFLASGHYLNRLQITADGKRLVTLSMDIEAGPYRIKIWDPKNGKLIRQTNIKEEVRYVDLALLPADRGIVIISHTELTFYNLETLNVERRLPINGNTTGARILFLKISPDSRFGAVIEQDTLRIIDFENAEQSFNLLSLGYREVIDFKFSQSGKYYAVVVGRARAEQGEDGKQFSKEDYYRFNGTDLVYVFAAGSKNAPLLALDLMCCDSLCFTPDEESLVLINEAGRIDLVDIPAKKIRARLDCLTDLQFNSSIRGFINPYGLSNTHRGTGKIDVTPDGKKALGCVGQGYLKVLEITRDSIRAAGDFYSHEAVRSLAVVGNSLAITSNLAKELNVWDLAAVKMVRNLQDNDQIRDFNATVSDGLLQVYSRNDQNLIRFWDLADISAAPKASERLDRGRLSQVNGLQVSPDGQAFAAYKVMFFQIFDVPSQQEIRQLPAAPPPTASVQFYPDRARLASISIDGAIRTWDYRSGQLEKSIQLKHLGAGNYVHSVVLVGDGQWMVYCDSANQLKMINFASGTEYEFASGPELPATGPLYNPDLFTPKSWGRSAVTLLADGCSLISFVYIPHVHGSQAPEHLRGQLDFTEEFVEIHDLKTGSLKKQFSDRESIWIGLGFKASNSKEIAYQLVAKKRRGVYGAMDEFCIETLNVQTGERTVLVSRATPIRAFDVTPDEKKLVLLTIEGLIEIRSIPSGQVLAHFKGDQVFTCCALTPDGKTILVGDDGGEVNFLRFENDPDAAEMVSIETAAPGEIAGAWVGKVWPPTANKPEPLAADHALEKANVAPAYLPLINRGQRPSIPPSFPEAFPIPAAQTVRPEKAASIPSARKTGKVRGRKPLNKTLRNWLIVLFLVILLIAAFVFFDQVLLPTPAVFLTPLPQATQVHP